MATPRVSAFERFRADLARVSPHAQLSLAARCARRVEPLFVASTRPLNPSDRDAVLKAVHTLDELVAGTVHGDGYLEGIYEASKEVSRQCGQRDDYHPARRTSACITVAMRAAMSYAKKEDLLDDVIKATDKAALAASDVVWMVEAITADINTAIAMSPTAKKRTTATAPNYGEFWPLGMPPGWPENLIINDAFLSHASEDKDAFVRPVANDLTQRGYKIWYDEQSLEIGDSLLVKINLGLSRSRHGIVVFSHNFFQKQWTIDELTGLFVLLHAKRLSILPVWYNFTRNDFINYGWPMFADMVACVGTDPVVVAEKMANRLGASIVTRR